MSLRERRCHQELLIQIWLSVERLVERAYGLTKEPRGLAAYPIEELMLPGEREAEREIRTVFGADLDLLAEAIRETLGLLDSDQVKGTFGEGTDHLVVQLSLGLLTKAVKQARSVILLAEKGYGQDANSVARSLLETALAMAFVLAESLVLQTQGRPLPPVEDIEFDSRFRARLYLANVVFERARTAREWLKVEGLKEALAPERNAALEAADREAEELIGPAWAKRLREKRSFSGVSIKDLAASLNLEQTYAVAYKAGSWNVHAADVDQFIDINLVEGPTVNLAPGKSMVRESLVSATLSLVMAFSFIDDRFKLGAEVAARRLRMSLGLPE